MSLQPYHLPWSQWQLLAAGRGESVFSKGLAPAKSPVEDYASKNIRVAQIGIEGFYKMEAGHSGACRPSMPVLKK